MLCHFAVTSLAEAEYYIHNVSAAQTVSAGWSLKVKPRTLGPA